MGQELRIEDNTNTFLVITCKSSTFLLLRFSRNYIFKDDLSNISKTICPIDFKLGTHILNGIIYDVA